MAGNAIRSPGSRLSDDLYRLYLVAMSWLIFPVYGDIFEAVLPTSQSTLRWVFPALAIVTQLGWLWSGFRGGPMTVTRASLVLELGAPVSARTILGPQLLRQAIGWGAGGVVLGGTLTALGDDFAFASALVASAAGFLLGFGAGAWACTLMVGVRSAGTTRTLYVGLAAVACVAVIATALVASDLTSGASLAVLGAVAAIGSVTAWQALEAVPLPLLWKRARSLEDARSALQQVDFHRVLVNLRNAGESRPIGRSRRPGRWLSWWRLFAPIRHGLPWSGLRIAAGVGAGVLLLLSGDLDQGFVLAAFGAVWLLVGYELTRALASIVEHSSFDVHYPRSSLPLIAGQVLVTFVIGVALIVPVTGWWLLNDSIEGRAAAIVAFSGIVAGALQARLGSPDTARFVNQFSLQGAAGLLWARALAAPLWVVIIVVLAFHGYELQTNEFLSEAQIEVAPIALSVLPAAFIGVVLVCINPLRSLTR